MYIRGVSSQLSISAVSLQVQGQKWDIIVKKMVRGYFRCIELNCFYLLTPIIQFNPVTNYTELAQSHKAVTLQMSTANECPLSSFRLEKFAGTARTPEDTLLTNASVLERILLRNCQWKRYKGQGTGEEAQASMPSHGTSHLGVFINPEALQV